MGVIAVASAAILGGCGGSGDSGGPGSESGSLKVYSAQLPDGAEMELVLTDTGSGWSGTIDEASSTESAENISGVFSGARNGNSVSANCAFDDGTTFTLTGSYASDGSIHLARSDMAGVNLVFTPASVNPVPATRGIVKFRASFIGGSTDFIVTGNDTPYSYDNNFLRYAATGTYLTLGGYKEATVLINVRRAHPLASITVHLPNSTYILADQPVSSLSELATKTASSSIGLTSLGDVSTRNFGLMTSPQ